MIGLEFINYQKMVDYRSIPPSLLLDPSPIYSFLSNLKLLILDLAWLTPSSLK